MAAIDSLEIQISTSANDAVAVVARLASVLDRLDSSLNRTERAAEGAADAIREDSNVTAEAAHETERAGDSVNTFGDRLRSVIGPIGTFARASAHAFGAVLIGATHRIGNFIHGIARIARFRIYRSIIKDIGQSFKDLYGWSNMFGTGFSRSMDSIHSSMVYLRNSLAAMVAPLVNALAPALDLIVDKLVEVMNWFNQLFSALSGAQTYTVARRVARTWDESFGTAATHARQRINEIKRTILGFDEINKLDKDSDSGTGGSTGSSPYTQGYQYMFEQLPLSSGFQGFSDAIERALEDTMSRIGLIISGATLALGAVLLFSGANPALGLGLMAAGAIGLGSIILANWTGISDKIRSAVGSIEAIVAGGLAVGAVLAFSGGHIGLGIGLMAAALTSGYGAATILWNSIPNKVDASVRTIGGIVAGASLVLGAVLTFSGHPTIGIPMLIGGLTVSATAINWDFIGNKVNSKVTAITNYVSAASLALGAIIALSGVNTPLGIGLMAAGAVGLGYSATLNWSSLYTTVKSWLKSYGAQAGVSTLAIGAILALSGVSTPIGIGLMAAGAITLGLSAVLNWTSLYTTIQSWLKSYGTIVGGALLGVGAILALSGVSTPIGIAMIAAGAVTLGYSAVLKYNSLYTAIKSWLDAYGTMVGSALLALGALLALSGVNTPLGIGLIAAGAVTLGYSATLSWSSLYTNVKSWLESYGGIVGKSLLALGALLALTGVATPIGIGLMAAGAVTLGFSAVLNWTSLYTSITTWLGAYTDVLSAGLLALGAILAFSGVATPLGIGLMAAGALSLGLSAAINWTSLYTSLQSWLTSYGTLVGGALLALGAVLAFTGIATPLGIGIMAAGALTLGLSGVVQWATFYNTMRSWLEAYGAEIGKALLLLGIVAMVGGAIPLGIGLLIAGAGAIFATNEANWQNLVNFGKTAIEKVKEGWENAKEFLVDVVVDIGGHIWKFGEKLWDLLWGTDEQEEERHRTVAATLNLKPGTGFEDFNSDIYSDPSMWMLDDRIQQSFDNNPLSAPVILERSGWWSVDTWIRENQWAVTPVTMAIDLVRNGWWSVDTWINSMGWAQTPVYQAINLGVANWNDFLGGIGRTLHAWWPSLFAEGGAIDASGNIQRFAGGGIINAYAGGTNNAHGSLFLAGEAGPELVGHIGGRTEVLNKSQLAAAMYSAVHSAMAGVSLDVNYNGTDNGNSDVAEDIYELIGIMRESANAAQRQNDLLRQQIEYLRMIEQKPLEVSTAQINRAQSYANRRAGTTVVSVG